MTDQARLLISKIYYNTTNQLRMKKKRYVTKFQKSTREKIMAKKPLLISSAEEFQ